MFTFFLKKNFSDGWENFFLLIMQNVFPLAFAALAYKALRLTSRALPAMQYPALVLAAGLFSVLVFSCGMNAAKIANFESGALSLFFSSMRHVWKTGLAFGALCAVAALLIRFAVSYYVALYLGTGNRAGIVLAAALGWFALVCAVALQWFIPLYFLQDDNTFAQCLKKSFIVFFDNAGFSALVFVYNILLALLSLVAFSLVPGVSGLVLSCTNALRLRLHKYDWMEKMAEKEPGFADDRDRRNDVPWAELLAEDRETLGPLKLGNIIFPWK